MGSTTREESVRHPVDRPGDLDNEWPVLWKLGEWSKKETEIKKNKQTQKPYILLDNIICDCIHIMIASE